MTASGMGAKLDRQPARFRQRRIFARRLWLAIQTRQNQTRTRNAASQQGGEVSGAALRTHARQRAAGVALSRPRSTWAPPRARLPLASKTPRSPRRTNCNDLMQRAALGIFGATPDFNKQGKPTALIVQALFVGRSDFLRRFRGARGADSDRGADYRQHHARLGLRAHQRNRHLFFDWSGADSRRPRCSSPKPSFTRFWARFRAISSRKSSPKSSPRPTLLPGITLNYSSSSAVLATLIVMATVLLSTLYPAWAASQISQSRRAQRPNWANRWAIVALAVPLHGFGPAIAGHGAVFGRLLRVAHRYFGREILHRQSLFLGAAAARSGRIA